MQTNKNDMTVEKSVSMRSHAFERPCKRQIVTDTKLRNASGIYIYSKKYHTRRSKKCFDFSKALITNN